MNSAFLPFAKETLPGLFRNDSLIVSNATCKARGAIQPCEGCTTGSACQYPVRPENTGVNEGRSTSMSDRTNLYSSTASTAYRPLCSPKTIPASSLRKSVTSSMMETHTRSDSAASIGTTSSDSNKNSWATVTRARATQPLTDEAPKPNYEYAHPSSVARNKRGQRIDSSLEYDREAVQRLKKLKLCNQFYIGGGCCHFAAGKADKCPHRHDVNLSSSEKHCLRVVARETPCKRGTTCDDLKCIYGHKCPFPIAAEGSLRGTCMNGELCRFPREMHGMDLVPVKYTKITGSF
ncbi:hypothetical protein MRB53_039975 [Persea americana]|nr:hypothetical protein MRB53_039975 [Persea americana]